MSSGNTTKPSKARVVCSYQGSSPLVFHVGEAVVFLFEGF